MSVNPIKSVSESTIKNVHWGNAVFKMYTGDPVQRAIIQKWPLTLFTSDQLSFKFTPLTVQFNNMQQKTCWDAKQMCRRICSQAELEILNECFVDFVP